MADTNKLTRDAGPTGWTVKDGTKYEIAGWELFEGDPDSPHQYRGWFRMTDKAFVTKKGRTLHLTLAGGESGADRELDVTVLHVSTTEPLVEFRAVR